MAELPPPPRRRSEDGSMAVTMMIAFIATALTAALLTTVWRDLRASRRSGDSANALQAADAGVNEAVRAVKTAAGTTGGCATYSNLPGFTRTASLGNASYTVCAAQDVDSRGNPVWHIDSLGTDASGVKRRVRADAVTEPLYPNAIEVFATAAVGAGFSLDSYRDEQNRCTRKGTLGLNDPASLTWPSSGQGGGVIQNCQNLAPSATAGNWPHPPDGCIAYSRDGTLAVGSNNIGSGKCPSTNSSSASPELSVPTRTPPANPDFPPTAPRPGGSLSCPSTTPTLEPGKSYYYSSVTLGVGCKVEHGALAGTAMSRPVQIFTNALTIAGATGAGHPNRINEPPAALIAGGTTVCGSTHGQPGSLHEYCPGWPGGLEIFVLSGGSVTFSGNHAKFWGVINAPSATASWSSGAPSYEVWGSMIVQSVSGGVQAKWHYDESLGSVISGRFTLANWRAEGHQTQ